MTTLRKAAQQALEALKADDSKLWPSERRTIAITALRAALAQEQAEPPTNQCGETCERAKLCAACARALEEPTGKQSLQVEPMQEPVAVVGTQVDVWRGCDGRWAPPGEPIKTALMLKDIPVGTMLYTAPPRCPNCASLEAQNTELDRKLAELEQAEPLTEEEIERICEEYQSPRQLARAVERAHGIGAQS